MYAQINPIPKSTFFPQRLCEELEYSELLDKAASSTDSAVDRMMWVAAFAVSVYGSCQARAGHKPFNPLLGESGLGAVRSCIRFGVRFDVKGVPQASVFSAEMGPFAESKNAAVCCRKVRFKRRLCFLERQFKSFLGQFLTFSILASI